SGIASCTDPLTLTSEGLAQPVTGTATDNAGNTAVDHATVSIDTTAPTITAAVGGTANPAGWYSTAITVTFTCTDGLSGVDTCTGPKALTDGADQSASGTAVDAAGNSATATRSGLNVDTVAPSLSGQVLDSPNEHGWFKGDVHVGWLCSDSLSGIAGSCP